MRNLTKTLAISLAASFGLAAFIVFPTQKAEAKDSIVRTAQGTYRCHKTGFFKKKTVCTRVSTVRRR